VFGGKKKEGEYNQTGIKKTVMGIGIFTKWRSLFSSSEKGDP